MRRLVDELRRLIATELFGWALRVHFEETMVFAYRLTVMAIAEHERWKARQ